MPDRRTDHPDFYRLATSLRSLIIDYDYFKTRKLLDPNWNGYDMPKGHNIIRDNVDLGDANLLTSQHTADPDLHRIVLDLDYGVRQPIFTGMGGHRLTLARNPKAQSTAPAKYLVAALPPEHVRALPGRGVLNLDPLCDFALMQSTTPDHYHLILDVNLPWEKYRRLLRLFADYGVIEPGYAKGAIANGFSAIRPPWIRKDTKWLPA